MRSPAAWLNFKRGSSSNDMTRCGGKKNTGQPKKSEINEKIVKISFVSFIIVCFVYSPAFYSPAQSRSSRDFDRLAAQAAQAREGNRVDEAISLYRQSLRLRPKWDEGWFYLGTLLHERDNHPEAARAFKEAAGLNPSVGTAWVMLGLSEFKLGRYNDALKHLQQGRQLGITDNPNLRNVMLYHEGLLLLDKEDFETAQKTLGSLSREGIDNEDLIAALGLSVLRVRPSDLPSADPTTQMAIGRAGQAEHLTVQKKFAEARGQYDRLAADFPRLANVQYAYGRFLLTSNDDDRAISAFQREIENSPEHLLARLMIADTKLKLRDAAGGMPYAEEAVKLNPRLPLAHYLLGSLLLEAGQVARAIVELETAQRLLPDEPKIYFALGRAYGRANRKADAERARAAFERLNKKEEAKERLK
jgi:tetratricopeptide (TPR) repeat protein